MSDDNTLWPRVDAALRGLATIESSGFLLDGTPILDAENQARMAAMGWRTWPGYPQRGWRLDGGPDDVSDDTASPPPGTRTEIVSGENGTIAWMRVTDPDGVVVFETGTRPARRSKRMK